MALLRGFAAVVQNFDVTRGPLAGVRWQVRWAIWEGHHCGPRASDNPNQVQAMHVAGIEKFLAEIWGWSGTNFGGSYAGSGAPL